MIARLTRWSNSRSGEKTWLHGSGWKILIELNTSKISDSFFSRLGFLVWDGVSCTGLVYPSKIWPVILSSATALELGRIRTWKSYLFFFLWTNAVQLGLPLLDSGFAHFVLSNTHVIESLGIWHYDQIILVIMDLGTCWRVYRMSIYISLQSWAKR